MLLLPEAKWHLLLLPTSVYPAEWGWHSLFVSEHGWIDLDIIGSPQSCCGCPGAREQGRHLLQPGDFYRNVMHQVAVVSNGSILVSVWILESCLFLKQGFAFMSLYLVNPIGGVWGNIFGGICPKNDLAASQIISSACERSTEGPVLLSAAVATASSSVSGWATEWVWTGGKRAEECGSVFQQSMVTWQEGWASCWMTHPDRCLGRKHLLLVLFVSAAWV